MYSTRKNDILKPNTIPIRKFYMAYTITIVDDDQTQSEYLKNIVLSWATERQAYVTLSLFASAESFLFSEGKPDILLLDIEMPKMSGIQLAKKIREYNETIPIVFITGYSDYIAEGYDVSALHYLLKPIDKNKLYSVLDKAVRQIGKNEKTLSIEVWGETFIVPLREIRYIEVSGNYITVHAKQDFKIKKTLGELEKQLDERFVRTGRSFIVNLNFVRRVTKTDVYLSSGEVVPLSRGMYELLNRSIIDRT